MADYYPVLKRAIASLPSTSGESRRIVYEKARAALLRQLQSYDPPLSPGEITDQRLALEECIRRVESEVAGAAFGLPGQSDPADTPTAAPPTAAPPTAASPAPAEPAPAAIRKPEPPTARTEPPAARPEPPRPEPPVAAPPGRDAAPPPPVTVNVQKPLPTATLRPEPKVEPRMRPEPGPDAKIGAGMSALSKTLRSAENLGGASKEAVRSARGAIEDEEPIGQAARTEPERVEPDLMRRPLGLDVASKNTEPDDLPPPREPERRPHRRERSVAAQRVVVPRRRRSLSPAVIGLLILILAITAAAAIGIWQRDRLMALIGGDEATPPPTEVAAPSSGDNLEPKILDRLPQDGEPASPVAPDAVAVQTEPVPPDTGDDMPSDPAVMADAPEAPAPAAEPPPAPATEPVTTATPAPTAAPAAPEQPAVLVAQRAILYEEPVPGSEGARVEGQVLWTFVNEPVLPGEPAQPQARATIEIPDRGIRLVVSIRKNNDTALPASHITQLTFSLPPDFSGRTIDTTPGLILKETEDARGDPLIGAVAKVADNLFWLALSGTPQEVDRNIALMKERQWFDVPIRYGDRRRAILTFEKGAPGEAVFRQAFETWGS